LSTYGARRVPGLRREEIAVAPAIVSTVYGDYLAANALGRAL
jgi:hypothetical protein